MKLAGQIAGEALVSVEQVIANRSAGYEARRRGRALPVFLAEEYPGLEKVVPATVTLAELVDSVSDAGLEDAAARVRQCERCIDAACEPDHMGLSPGWIPSWRAGKLERHACDRHAEWKLSMALRDAGVGVELAKRARFESFVAETTQQSVALGLAKDYAADFRQMTGHERGLHLAGALGVGKTHLAVAVMADLIRRRIVKRARFVFVPEFLEQIRASFKDPASSPVEGAKQAELLVLDDLGGHSTSDWVRQQLTIIINTRWSEGRATIVTTNAEPGELDVTLGERSASRLAGMLRARAVIDGEDRRHDRTETTRQER